MLPVLSGWQVTASVLYAFLISSCDAVLSTPRTLSASSLVSFVISRLMAVLLSFRFRFEEQVLSQIKHFCSEFGIGNSNAVFLGQVDEPVL